MTPRPRSVALVAVLASALLATSACSSTPSPSDTPASSQSSTASAVDHIYGTTEFTTPPTRVATISWVNADAVLALDVVPVGMDSDIWGNNAHNSTDWKDAKLAELGAAIGSTGAPVQFDVSDGIDYAGIAKAKPDAIFAAYSGLSKEEYDKLSKIAPTVGPLAANYTAPWQDVTRAAGEMLGKADAAAAVVKDVEAQIAQQTEKFPELKGATFIAGNLEPAKGGINVYTSGDTRPRFLTALGMVEAPIVKQLATGTGFYTNVSPERADELDSDVFFSWGPGGQNADEVVAANPLFGRIPAYGKGGLVLLTNDADVLAISASSPLSLPWAIDTVVPAIAAGAKAAVGR